MATIEQIEKELNKSELLKFMKAKYTLEDLMQFRSLRVANLALDHGYDPKALDACLNGTADCFGFNSNKLWLIDSRTITQQQILDVCQEYSLGCYLSFYDLGYGHSEFADIVAANLASNDFVYKPYHYLRKLGYSHQRVLDEFVEFGVDVAVLRSHVPMGKKQLEEFKKLTAALFTSHNEFLTFVSLRQEQIAFAQALEVSKMAASYDIECPREYLLMLRSGFTHTEACLAVQHFGWLEKEVFEPSNSDVGPKYLIAHVLGLSDELKALLIRICEL